MKLASLIAAFLCFLTTSAMAASTKATLIWTAPSDNQRVALYDLRYSAAAPTPDWMPWWSAATPLPGLPKPSAAGNKDSMVVAKPDMGSRYFAVRSTDPSGNWSRISNFVLVLADTVPWQHLKVSLTVPTTMVSNRNCSAPVLIASSGSMTVHLRGVGAITKEDSASATAGGSVPFDWLVPVGSYTMRAWTTVAGTAGCDTSFVRSVIAPPPPPPPIPSIPGVK